MLAPDVEFRPHRSTTLESITEETLMATIQRITPCLWFDTEAEEAAKRRSGGAGLLMDEALC